MEQARSAIAVAEVPSATGAAPCKGVGETSRSEWRLGVFHYQFNLSINRANLYLGRETMCLQECGFHRTITGRIEPFCEHQETRHDKHRANPRLATAVPAGGRRSPGGRRGAGAGRAGHAQHRGRGGQPGRHAKGAGGVSRPEPGFGVEHDLHQRPRAADPRQDQGHAGGRARRHRSGADRHRRAGRRHRAGPVAQAPARARQLVQGRHRQVPPRRRQDAAAGPGLRAGGELHAGRAAA